MSGEKLLFERLSGEIIGAAIRVQQALGPGLLESTYPACLLHELRKAGLEVQAEVCVPLQYDSLQIENAYRLDLLVGGIRRVLNPRI